jgi:hypothetical protein
MATKIHIRAGEVELTLESDNPLAVSDIKDFITQVQDAAQSLAPVIAAEVPSKPSPNGQADSLLLLQHTSPQLHVNSVADRVGAKSASELVIASAAYLQVVEGKQSFTRKELLDTMKSATSHYNQNMGSNLTASLKSLTTSKLNQLANGTYSLKSHELSELRNKLAE